MPLLRLNNPLIFPGGLPGFNSAHPAASFPRFSGIATSGGAILPLFNPAPPTIIGSPTSSIGTVGPQVNFPAGTPQRYNQYPGLNETPSSVLFGAILTPIVSNGNFGCIFNADGPVAGTGRCYLSISNLVISFGTSTYQVQTTSSLTVGV